jgi:hypothetical protein
MKTKTLLIAAAALAVGIISSQAQVYSQNVVGYVNQPIPANSYQIVGSQLIGGSDVNATNGNINTTLLNGFISSPNDPPNLSSNSVIYVWNGSGYAQFYYFNQADANTWNGTPVAGWYDTLGNMANVNLNKGQAAFIQNHSSFPMTITTTGNVLGGTSGSTNITLINAGYNLVALQVSISTNPIVSGYGLPGNLTSSPLDPPLASRNDVIFAWNGAGYAQYYFFNQADATTWQGFASPAGFYDSLGNAMPSSSYPQVNQGFFLYHTGASITWTNGYSVQ